MLTVTSRSPVRMGVALDMTAASAAKAAGNAGEAPPAWETETRSPRVTPESSAIRPARALASSTAKGKGLVFEGGGVFDGEVDAVDSNGVTTRFYHVGNQVAQGIQVSYPDANLVGYLVASNLGRAVVAVVVLGVDVEIAGLGVALVDVVVRKNLEDVVQGGVGGVQRIADGGGEDLHAEVDEGEVRLGAGGACTGDDDALTGNVGFLVDGFSRHSSRSRHVAGGNVAGVGSRRAVLVAGDDEEDEDQDGCQCGDQD